jgi:radical SAM superfamily enzyme YgiQ (UPF0313 family)
MATDEVFNIIDGLIIYQGEIPLLELCRAIEHNQSLENVPQLIWRKEKGNIKFNKKIAKLDLESVPPPDYRGFPVGKYWGVNYLNLIASRGCYHGKCSFCAIPFGWGNNGYAGMRSVEKVFSDIEIQMERHGINRFKFVDESLNPNFMKSLSRKILAEGLKINWEGYARMESVWYDEKFVELIAKAGFRKGYFGLELATSNDRLCLNKNDSAYPKDLLSICSTYGIKVHFFTMYGFPGTAEVEAAKNLEFILNNKQRIDTVDIFPWDFVRHTSLPGVEPVIKPEKDWALKLEYKTTREGILKSEEVEELANRCEEIIWGEEPKLLHPTYRLISPWLQSSTINS